MSDPDPETLPRKKNRKGKPAISAVLIKDWNLPPICQGGKYALRHLYQHFLLNSQAKAAIKIAAIV